MDNVGINPFESLKIDIKEHQRSIKILLSIICIVLILSFLGFSSMTYMAYESFQYWSRMIEKFVDLEIINKDSFNEQLSQFSGNERPMIGIKDTIYYSFFFLSSFSLLLLSGMIRHHLKEISYLKRVKNEFMKIEFSENKTEKMQSALLNENLLKFNVQTGKLSVLDPIRKNI